MTEPLRISAIRFLNPAPLMWDFEHSPTKEQLAARYSIHHSTPAECAGELANGTADIGLVPIAAYATVPGLAVIPGCTIASPGRVRSILLIVKSLKGLGGMQRVAADTASQTSNAYAQIIFRMFHRIDPEFVPHAPDLDAMLDDCDGAILIGDPALLALEDRKARLERTGQALEYIDLSYEWKRYTSAVWISAFWAVRPEAVRLSGLTAAAVTQDFTNSRNHGMAHVEDLVQEWSPKIAVPPETIRTYLSHNIQYVLDEKCAAGIELFYRYAADCGVLPEAPPIQWL